MAFSKIKKSFAPKPPRTRQEINQEYNQHAANAGHKAALAQKFLTEVEQHHAKMFELSAEEAALPRQIPPNVPIESAHRLDQEQEHA